jgi:outer membrane protein
MSHTSMRLCLGLLVALGIGAASGVANAQKIAVVNFQRAVEESSEGKTALTQLRTDFEKKQKELDAKKEELKKLDEDLAKQAPVLKPELLEKKRQELAQKAQQWQDAAMRAQKDINDKQMRATQPLEEKLLRAVAFIAARDKFTLVLRAEAVAWPQQTEMDITNEVIRKANELKAAPPAAPPPAK